MPSGRRASSTEGGRGVCGDVQVAVEVPGDGDGVDGGLDRCPDVDGEDPFFPGCPTLERTVTATYADAEVTGLVSTPGRAEACGGRARLTAAAWAPDGTAHPVATFESEADGTYRLASAGVPGTRYQVTAVRWGWTRAGRKRATR